MKKTLLFLVAILAASFAFAAGHTVSINPVPVTCFAGNNGSATATVTGGVGPFMYSWAPSGGTNVTATGLIAGTYTCYVTDQSDMSVSNGTVQITQPTPMSASPNITNATCNSSCNGSINQFVIGGTPPYSYYWPSLNYFTQNANSLCPGVYSCLITDANGCVANPNYTITSPPPVNVNISPLNPSICAGDGVILTGSGAITYNWQPGNIFGNNVNVYPTVTTTYTLLGTDVNGCTGVNTMQVTVNQRPSIILVSMTPAGCNMSDGSIASMAGAGTPPYNFAWYTSPMQSTQLAVNLATGTYSCVLTDSNGCLDTLNATVTDSCDYVWPGDANDDAVANNVDILDIGIANGATGTTRANASTNWIGQPSTAWGQTLMSGTDYKWVDCNGDGSINPSDTNAVVQNFGFTHNNRLGAAPVYDASLPDLSVVLNQSQIGAGNSGTLNINLGTSAIPATDVYGLAFTLNFDGTQIDAASFHMNENGSWMGTAGNDLMGVVLRPATGNNSVQVAITRLDHNNANGAGNIANMAFTTTSLLNGSGNTANVLFSISNVTLISANETTMQVNTISDSVTVMDPLLMSAGTDLHAENPVSVFPNPVNDNATILLPEKFASGSNEIVLTDAAGRIIRSEKFTGAKCIFNCESVSGGMYFISVYSGGEIVSTKRIVIE